ncbi:MAG: hypothetical protein U1E46_11140 [Hyphomicrobiales bacterium]
MDQEMSRKPTVSGLPARRSDPHLRTELPLDKLEVAEYIADVSLQLRHMAQAVDLKFLTYLLEMVFEESFTTTKNLRK